MPGFVLAAPSQQAGDPAYARRVPDDTVLYGVVSGQLGTFFASRTRSNAGREVPAFAARELTRYLDCVILAHGFVRVRCSGCTHVPVRQWALSLPLSGSSS